VSIVDLLLDPLRYEFMVRALATAVVAAVVCAVLSCWLVLIGWSLMGDAVSHAVLPGIILAYVAGLPMSLGAVASGMACVLSAGAIEARCRVKSDAVLGIAFTGFLALGMVLLVATPSDIHFMHVLFGNLLGIEPADMIQTLAVGSVTLAAVLVLRRDLILFCFDPGQARVTGISPRRLELILLLLVAATIVAALQAVGVVLVMAMLVTPGCIGLLLADRFGRVMAAAVGSAVLSSVLGTLLSFWLDGATGPSIVVVQALLFALAFLFAPKNGLLRRVRTSPADPGQLQA